MKQSFNLYKQVLALKGAKSLLLLSVIARLGTIQFAAFITIATYQASGSWRVAGFSGGAAALGAAPSNWILGRAIDRWSTRTVMFWTAPLSVTILLILIPSSDAWIVATSFIAGAIKPPLGITFRSGWMRIAPEKPLRPAAYSLESLTIPFSTAIGSFIAGALLFIGPEAVLIFVCLSTLIGSVAMIFHPATSPMPQELEVLKYDPSSQESSSFELSSPGLGKKTWVVLIAVALSWALLVGAEMSVGVTYGAQELAWASGFSTLALVIGSLAVTYNLERSSYSYTMLGLAIAAASMILMSFIVTYSLLLAIVGMVLLGAGRGMVSAAGSSSISETAPVSRVSEAMGLYASGLLLSQTSYRSLAPLLASPAAIAAAPALVGFLFWIFYRKEDE